MLDGAFLSPTSFGSHINQLVPVRPRVSSPAISIALSPWRLSSEGWPLAVEFPSFMLLNQLKHINLQLQKSNPASFSRRPARSISSSSMQRAFVAPILFSFAINPRQSGCSRDENTGRMILCPPRVRFAKLGWRMFSGRLPLPNTAQPLAIPNVPCGLGPPRPCFGTQQTTVYYGTGSERVRFHGFLGALHAQVPYLSSGLSVWCQLALS